VPIETEWGSVRIKVGLLNGEIVNYAAEYEDCRAIAERHAVPLKQVMQVAVAAWRGAGSPALGSPK
jgi:uncharacterized protein (DUF111 family)